MTAGELTAALAELDPQLELLVAIGGDLVPLVGIASAGGSPYGVIHGVNKRKPTAAFTLDEQGVLGKLAGMGLNDVQIGLILGRPPEVITKKRKAMGLPNAK